MADATDRIYLTYKTRMTTERRLRRTGFIVDALMNWYALCLIALSVANLSKLFTISYVDLLSTILSIAVFGISLFAYGQKYGDRADAFRSCYLELQELYNSDQPASNKLMSYADILKRYHNQTDDDYDAMLVENFMRGISLENSSGPITVNCLMITRFFTKTILRGLIVTVLFIAPPIAGLCWINLLPHSDASRQKITSPALVNAQ